MAEISKARASRCTTHHYCDCAAYRLQQMSMALRVIDTWASVPGALDAKQVKDLCKKALASLQEGAKG